MDKSPNHTPLHSGSEMCSQMALSVIDDFTNQMISTIETTGKNFGPADLRSFLEAYKGEKIEKLGPTFKTLFQKCQVRREQEIFDRSRKEPFKRVFLMRIAEWFPPDGGLANAKTFLSRRMIQGLFSALEKMGSYERYTCGHERSIKIAKELKEEAGGRLCWEDLYNHPEIIQCTDDLIMDLVPHFNNPHKRMEWLRTLINNNISPFENYAFEGEASRYWLLDEHKTRIMLRSLFYRLSEKLKNEQGEHSIIERYGQKETQALKDLIDLLDAPSD